MISNYPSSPVAVLAVVFKVTKDDLLVGKNSLDLMLPDEREDLSRFEGEGGPEVPGPDLMDVPPDNAIWRKTCRANCPAKTI